MFTSNKLKRAFMKYFLLVVCLSLGLSFSALASNPNANINKGNISVGGGLDLNYNTVSGTSFFVNPKAEYFIADNLSLGGSVSYTVFGSAGYITFGPAISYYFWSQEKLATYVGGDLLINGGANSTNNLTFDGNVGLNWFIVPTVAFGPALLFSHMFTSPDSSATSNYYLLGTFSIFL